MEYDLNDLSFVERMLGELPSCVFFKDRDCRYVFSTKYWNHLNCDEEGWTIRGKTDLDIRKDKENALLAMEQDRKIIDTGIGSTYTIQEHVAGVAEYLEIIKRPVHGDDGDVVGIVGLINDVTEKEELRMRWERSAHTDALTGLSNRCCFDDVKDSFDPSQYPIAVIMADCDCLKRVNDTLGHAMGDNYIRSAAVVLRSAMPADALIFRMGGDEFVALLPNTDEPRARACIEAARRLLSQMSLGPCEMSMSFGLSMLASRQDLTERAVEAADRRMYQEKRLHHAAMSAHAAAPAPEASSSEEIPSVRKAMLDSMFTAYETVAEGAYVYFCDLKYDFSRWSESAIHRFGLPGEYMYGAGWIWEEHIHPDDQRGYSESIRGIFAGTDSGHDMQYRAKTKDGRYVVCTCRGSVLRNADGNPEYFMGCIRENGTVNSIDSLTGLQNQYALFDRLDALFEQRERACMMLVGIAHFSTINEMWGYELGNTIIHKLVQLLKEEFRNEGALYRVDGVRFVLLTRTISIDELPARYEALRERIGRLVVDGFHPNLLVYGSALEIKSFDVSPSTMYPCLEYSSNVSKEQAHGQFQVFRDELDEYRSNLLTLINAVRRSIEDGCAGFMLHYQPVFDAETGALRGAEALLRWQSPEYGMVPPMRFIPIIENDPAFVVLGEWVLRTAMEGALPLLERHPGFMLNVNLSYQQIQQTSFVGMVKQLLEETGFPARNLCLELTERCRVVAPSMLSGIFRELHSIGVRFAIDDFGTGYSSVELMEKLPFDVLKIDKAYVDHVAENERSAKLIDVTNRLAELYGAKTCVEGVETEQQLKVLRRCCVDSIQGYYFSKPLPLDELVEAYG